MSTKIKICFFNDFFPFSRGGAEYQAYLLAKSLDPERYDVSFVSRGGNSEGEYHIDGFRIFFLNPLNFYKKFGRPYCLYYNQIKAILKNVRPHIVYQRTGSAVTGILSRLSSAYGFTFVWASASDVDLSMHTPSFRILSNIDDILRISGIRNAETVLAQSLAQQSRLVEKFGRQAIILPNGHPIPEKKMHKD
ncbi:MAG: glycosyltransferase family 4 protein, partial [Thermodesulfobacteriota bacterium]|nr:glycosyltransferase family 4 protein [Thermodesulfobacteriota bacterium]